MKLIRLALFIVISTLATSSFAQTVPMPNYLTWDKKEHSLRYLLDGKEVQMQDVHYRLADTKRREESQVVVFYHPSTQKEWFAVFSRLSSNGKNKAYIYRPDENKKWVLIRDITNDNPISILKEYGLVEIKQ